MVLAGIVAVGFLLVLWRLERLTRTMGQAIAVMIRASDMAHDNAHNILEAVFAIHDDLRAPGCVQGEHDLGEARGALAQYRNKVHYRPWTWPE